MIFRRIGRPLCALLAAVLAATAGPVAAQEKQFPAGKIFPMLARYLSLPPAARDKFTPIYVMRAKTGTLTGGRVWLVVKGRRTPLAIGPDGRLSRPESASDVEQGQIVMAFPPGTRAGIEVDVASTVMPRAELSVPQLEAGLSQANAALKTGLPLVGPPRLRRLVFPGGEGGEVVGADGRRTALQSGPSGPYFEPDGAPRAQLIRFRRPPAVILMDDGR